ncbi:zincin-like metallopeptidase domain-containing protein, partial [Pantoea sp. Ap-967]|uniref:zincin-like metallopeptidase domain-containing protein n=1 Tax=Pantoea sp. Ap-967 TaxID=2608362 RepID=UPI001F04C931
MKKEYAEEVAARIVEQLEQGTAPWQKPWQPGELRLPYNPTTGKEYKGMNSMWLSMQGHSDPRWMTYNQASADGGQVKKGSKGTHIVYWKFSEERKATDEQGRPILDPETGKQKTINVQLERPRSFMAVVFNASQIDGLPPLEARPTMPEPERHARAEAIMTNSGASIQHVPGDRAYYRPSTDSITLPERNQFPTADAYYATALHEVGHWTGHPSRLDRDLSHPFGSEGYAREELRAEIASLMLGERLDLGHDPGQHAAYVGSWIKALKEDPKEIFRAAADAERIAGYVMGFEQEQTKMQTVERQPVPEVAPEVLAVLQEQDANAVEGYSPLESWQMMKAEAERHGYTARIDFAHDPADAGQYGPSYDISYFDKQGQPTGIRTEMGSDSKLMTERNGKRLSQYISNDDESQPATLAKAIGEHEKAINSPRWTIERRDTFSQPIETVVIGQTDSAAEALAVFKSKPDTNVIDNYTGESAGSTEWVRDGSSPQWNTSAKLVAMVHAEEQGISLPITRPGATTPDQRLAEAVALAANHPEPGSNGQQWLMRDVSKATAEAFGEFKPSRNKGSLPEQWTGQARAVGLIVEGGNTEDDPDGIDVVAPPGVQPTHWQVEVQRGPHVDTFTGEIEGVERWEWFANDDTPDGAQAKATAQRLNAIGLMAGLSLEQADVAQVEAPQQEPAPVPVDWRYEACRVFDAEMAIATGNPDYDSAQQLSSALRQYEEMDFEYWSHNQAELDERKPAMDEAAQWIHDNVLLNPVVKERMFETVRDFGRDTGDAATDKARHDYLAEMSSGQQPTERSATPDATQRAEAWVLAHVQNSTIGRAMVNASTVQMEKAHDVLRDMQPLNTQNAFWQRHDLPDDVDALDAKIGAADQLLGDELTQRHYIASGDHDAAAVHREESDLAEQRKQQGYNDPAGQAYTVHSRRTVPENAAQHAGQQAVYVQLDDGRRAWGFGGSDEAAEKSAVKQAQRVGLDADRQATRPVKHEKPENPAQGRTYLAVPFTEKNEAKGLGAKWDKEAKAWYAPEGMDVATSGLARWKVENTNVASSNAVREIKDQFLVALRDAGLDVSGARDKKDHPVADGEMHRLPVFGRRSANTSGAYALHLEGKTPGGYIENFKTGEVVHWKPEGAVAALSEAERATLAKEARERQQARDNALDAKHEATASAAQALWKGAPAATAENAYCKAKGITNPVGLRTVPEKATPEMEAQGIRIAKTVKEAKALREADPANRVFKSGDLLIPGMDGEGKLWTLQSVNPHFKALMKGGRKAGTYTVVGTDDPAKALASKDGSPLVIAEGYATADTVSRLMGGKPVFVAFDSGNLDAVARDLRERSPDRPLLIAADNDHNAPKELDANGKPKVNVGLVKGKEAAEKNGGGLMVPQFKDGDKGSDWNDVATAQGDAAASRMLNEQMAVAKRDAAITAERLTTLARTRDMEARNDPTTSADDAAVSIERGHAAEVMAGAQAMLGEVRSMAAETRSSGTKGAGRSAASVKAGISHKVEAMHDKANEERQDVMNHAQPGALDGSTAGVSWKKLPEQVKQQLIA